MAIPTSSDSDTPRRPVVPAASDVAVPTEHKAHTDPISGEANAHPVGVGLGAASAGTAGAVIGAILGPIGAVVGAAIGAVAGGLAGKEIASTETVTAASQADEYSLAKSEGDVLTAPGVAVSPGAYAGSQEQTAVAPLDRLSRDVGYKDAHEAVPQSSTALPRDVVPAPYQPAEPGDAEYATTQRSGAPIPKSAIMQPPVPMAGENPSSISDLPLAQEQTSPAKDGGDALEEPFVTKDDDNVTEDHDSPYHLSDTPVAPTQTEPLKQGGDILESATDPESTLREKAYFKYLARLQTGDGGDERSDWANAERDSGGR